MSLKMKIFTLEEANRLIPVLESLLRDFQVKVQKMEEHALKLELPARREAPLPLSQARKTQEELYRLEAEVTDILKLINQVGCVIRDPRQGLIDFPSVRNQEPVYLCWKLGEKEVRFYHGAEDGFQGRKPL